MHKVIVYSTPTCPWCHKAKEYFTKLGQPYKDVNVAEDEKAAQEMIDKSGQLGVPVIDIDGKIIVGFDQPEIDKALKK
ncbi:glutathione S-transferase N-terminal domain-containing protein [Candidatus Micrarchaeota archaeon]|nr:glutathione S-transferase N-terminal domain-containing protein [Candidatus Micrarchaeota archaeon]